MDDGDALIESKKINWRGFAPDTENAYVVTIIAIFCICN